MRLSAGNFLAAFVTAASVSFAVSVAIGLHPFAEAGTNMLIPLLTCGDLFGGPHGRAVIATSLVLALTAAHLVPGVLAWRRARRRLADLIEAMTHLPASERNEQMTTVVERLDLHDSLVVVQTPDPFAITVAAGQSRIYISTGAVNALSEQELEGVLWHEKHHLQNRDAAKAELIAILRSTFGYLPALRRMTDRFVLAREFAADDAAVKQSIEARALLTAFIKLHPAQWTAPAAAGYSDYATLRAERLMARAPESRLFPGVISDAVIAVAFTAVLPAFALVLTEPHLASLL